MSSELLLEITEILAVVVILLLITVILLSIRLKRAKKTDNIENRIEASNEIEAEDKAMIRSVFEFGDTITREVMVPRIDIISLNINDTYAQAIEIFCRSGFSRMPVIGEDADQVEGIAYFKDLVDELLINNADGSENIAKLVRPALFVPESKPVDDLFRYMQEERQHMCLVIDEYAGIAGLVTLEDTLEEIVGELYDEHDNEDNDVDVERNDNGDALSGIFPARYSISDLNMLFNKEISHDDVDTILGLLNQRLGRVAIRGSKVVIDGLEFEAVSTSGRRRRIAKIRISRVSDDS